MSGSLQSHNYVPGMSGLKFDLKKGEFELNSSRITFGGTAKAPDRQLITITVGEWPDNELPSNAIERHAFIGAELEKIPAEFRERAELTTEDFSFDRDGSDYRTVLTYARQETQDEAKARYEKTKAAGTRISLVGGVLSISHDGVLRTQITNLQKDKKPAPFIVVDGVMYINSACIKEASVEGKITAQATYTCPAGTMLLCDKRVVSGIGLGLRAAGYAHFTL